MADRELRDLTDDEARGALVLKWGDLQPGVLPAWVAEMDFALDPVVVDAVARALADGMTGYAGFGTSGVGEALAAFAQRQWGWELDADQVVLAGDVMAGVRLALEVLSDPGPVVVPLPAYPPFLDVAGLTGRERVDLPLDPDEPEATIDLDRLDALLADGARTLLLCNPHNPWGRAFRRDELEGIRDVVVRHGARVIADEIHAPLVLPGATHVPYLALEGTSAHAVAVLSTSKSFNTAGLHCGQVVATDPVALAALKAVPVVQNNAYSPLGVVAARTAYAEGGPWLAALVERLDAQRTLLDDLLAAQLPEVRMRPLEATFLAWLDVRALGHADPADVALARGTVRLAPGHDYHPGVQGHVRLNIATSPDRLTAIVGRLASAWA